MDLEKKADSSSGPNSCDDNSCDPILEAEVLIILLFFFLNINYLLIY